MTEKQSEGVEAPSTDTAASPRPIAIVALLVLDLSFLINALDRQVLPVLLPQIGREYGLSAPASGLLATVFTLGLGVAGLASGFLADRFRRRTLMLVGIGVFSAATVAQPLAAGYADLLTYRILSGVGEGIQYTALFAAVGAYFDVHRGKALGSLNVAWGIGAFLSPLLGSVLAQGTGSWRTPFVLFGLLGLVNLVVIAVVVPRRLSEASSGAGSPDSRPTVDRVTSLANRNLVACVTLCAVLGFSGYGYLGQYPTYLTTALHFSPAATGIAAGGFGLGGLVSLVSGALIDRADPRAALLTAILVVMAAGWVVFNVPLGPVGQTLLSVVMGIASSGFLLVLLYTLIQRSAPSSSIGRASGLFTVAVYVPAAVSGYVFAELRTHLGWGGAATVQLTIVPVAALVAALALDHRVLRPSAPRAPRGPGDGPRA